MRIGTRKFALALSAAAAFAIAALLAWLFSRQGTLGLFQWHPTYRRIFILIGAAGLIPLVPSLLALPLLNKPAIRGASVLAILSIAFSALAILLAAGLFAGVETIAHAVDLPLPLVKLVDPSAGIPGSGGLVRLSLSSDPHWGAPQSDAMARRAILKSVAGAAPRRDAFLILGDNIEMGMNDSSWREESREISELQGDVPVRPLLGNHDGLIDGEHHFKTYFFPPSMRSDSGSPYYYSMVAGPATLIVLNLLWGAESFDRVQAAWLERTLAAVPAGRQVIVLSHCFFYASGYVDPDTNMPWYDHRGTIDRVSPILDRHKVALVVSGHNHYMEFLKSKGVSYAVIGAMGGLPDPEPTHHSPASLWFKRGSYGRLDLDIDGRGIALTFRDSEGSSLHEDFIPATP